MLPCLTDGKKMNALYAETIIIKNKRKFNESSMSSSWKKKI